MILLDVALATTADGRSDFVALLGRTMSASQDERGCLVYRFTADIADPLLFYLVELWEDEAALMAHAAGAPFRAFLADLPTCGRVLSSVARSGPLDPYTFQRPA